jgi:hypothetical protein
MRSILENLHTTDVLDAHPWASRLFVQDTVANDPALAGAAPGRQLVVAVGRVFEKTMPAMPPRRGKRLDTKWGEFGLLAAQYFAPLKFGTAIPKSLRDAWGRIDQSILLYVFGRAEALPEEQSQPYKLVGDELDAASTSTLSDWHTKGIKKLVKALERQDHYLAGRPSPPPLPHRSLSTVLLALALLAGAFLLWGGWKARRVYDLSQQVRQAAVQLQGQVGSSPGLQGVRDLEPDLKAMRTKFDLLQAEVSPFLWIAPRLSWLPVYGGDLASAPDLIELTDALLASVEQTHAAVLPLLDSSTTAEAQRDIVRSLSLLHQAGPQLALAQTELERAQKARDRLDTAALSPLLRRLVLEDLDRALLLMQDGLALALELPRLAGLTSEGSKTYLLIAQNEDELRPTGGFITAAGTLLVRDGRVVRVSFQNSSEFDNWEWPYPPAPWPLEQYMNSSVLIFRDANWYTNFPTSVEYIEYIYSYTNDHSVDGVIAFNQHLLVEVLRVTGPIKVEGEEGFVDADSVIDFMRAEKTPSAEDLASDDWNYKAFMNKITAALIEKLTRNEIPLDQLSELVVRVLDEHHLLLQLDNPQMTDLLARRNWDGTLRPGAGDYLMVVDSNVGFNKTNAVVQSSFAYDVDLTNPEFPEANLVVTHRNHASDQVACRPYPYIAASGISDDLLQRQYPIDRCYWNYLRVYTLPDVELLDAQTQAIPAEWTLRGQPVPPQVDVLDEELEGVRGFGAFEVVPGGESVMIAFHFALPSSVVQPGPFLEQIVYRLKIQKQPGTQATPVVLRVHLPPAADLLTAPPGAQIQGSNILVQLSLVQDVELEFIFALP